MGTPASRASWVAAAVALAACRQIVGIGDQPPTPGGSSDASAGACGAFPWATSACEACMHSACCTQATKCRADSGCSAAYDCSAKCAAGDEVCRAKCFAQAGTVDDAVVPLASCAAQSCSEACGLECGGWGVIAGAYLPSIERSASCRSCVASSGVCQSLAGCVRDESCLAQRVCVEDCVAFDGICTGNCAATHPSPTAEGGTGGGAATVTASFYTACQKPCALGTDWSCAGVESWPSSHAPTAQVGVYVQSFPDGSSITGATVKACDKGDPFCDNPLGGQHPTTDSAGQATLQIPTSFPFDGYFEVSAPSYVTVLAFPYPHVTESTQPAPGGEQYVALVPEQILSAFVAAAGGTFDATHGTIFLQPHDCSGTAAPYVSFQGDANLGPLAKPYYLVDESPNPSVSQTQPGTIIGGGFVDVAPGLLTVDTIYGGNVVSSVTLQVRAGALTEADPVPKQP